jgi:hypothetical protein
MPPSECKARVLKALSPYETNKNTGNYIEIFVLCILFRTMGDLTDETLEAVDARLSTVKSWDEIKREVQRTPLGKKLVFDGHTIVDILNVTQNDAIGNTGDILLVTDDNCHLSVSITLGLTRTKKGTIEKCLSNPSANNFKIGEEGRSYIKKTAEDAVIAYKAAFSKDYGEDETKWPTRKPTTIAKNACSSVASYVETQFKSLAEKDQTDIFRTVLQIDNASQLPADYVLGVKKGKQKWTLSCYKFESIACETWKPRIVADGIWLRLYNDANEIGKVQVKFNNGVYHKGKTSSLFSSWNCNVCLSSVFKMRSVKL